MKTNDYLKSQAVYPQKSGFNERHKGLLGTLFFHGILFLGLFLMSFAGGGGGNGDNGTGEALGGLEVSLGEPDLGGPDTEAGAVPNEETIAPEKAVDDETLTDDNSESPEVVSKKTDVKKVAPVITPPVFKKTTPNPIPKKIPDSKGLFKKGGNKGGGETPGNQGRDDGNPYGSNGDGDGNGDGTGKPGSGDGDGDGNGPGKGPGNGPGSGNSDGTVKFDLSGFKKNREFDIETNRSGSGTVIVKLCVYNDGRIKSVSQTLGGTMTDKYFIDLAIKAVKENSYSPLTGNMAETTCGLVKFTFKAR